MKAIIPVAGIGTRLQPLTNKTPKVLINVAGKPMLFHLIDEIINNGKIDTIILIIGYLGGQIKEAVEEKYGDSEMNFEFTEQKEMLGLGHAVYHANEFIDDEPVLIVLGDTIFEFSLDSMLSSKYSAIGVKDVEDTSRFGIVEPEGEFIKRMIEKPAPGVTESKSAIAGIYFIREGRKLMGAIEHLMENDIRTKNEYQLTDALMKLVADGEKMVPFEIENWFDCGKPETLLSTNGYLLRRDHDHTKQYTYKDIIFNPPVYIGENCLLENTEIGPNVTIADGASVSNSKITNSLICEGAVVNSAELDNVVVGNNEKLEGKHNNVIAADKLATKF
jgi:glucose-1-phosphate thymidylyltransferase